MTQNIKTLYNSFGQIQENTWLNGRNYSDAFVICVGAGPWKLGRRKTIQQLALDNLANRDLYELSLEDELKWFPLDWQNNFLNDIIDSLIRKTLMMEEFCTSIKNRQELYDACGCPNGAKVLSLFCRDKLKINAIPIDRHIKRALIENKLPISENDLIDLCNQNNINARLFGLGLAQKLGIENPDWSIRE